MLGHKRFFLAFFFFFFFPSLGTLLRTYYAEMHQFTDLDSYIYICIYSLIDPHFNPPPFVFTFFILFFFVWALEEWGWA